MPKTPTASRSPQTPFDGTSGRAIHPYWPMAFSALAAMSRTASSSSPSAFFKAGTESFASGPRQLSDSAACKRVMGSGSHSALAKTETENQWIRKDMEKTRNTLNSTTKANDDLMQNYHSLQREKEMAILKLTLSYEKKLSSYKI